jgi:hemerythrin-like domain-containing protein
MAVSIGGGPNNDFRNPLGLLGDCHRRIEYFLRLLVVVTDRTQGGSLDEEERRALEAALRYFRMAAPKHTLDEEESLFPRMRASSNPQSQAALAMLDALHAEHELADELHRQVEVVAGRWLEQGSLSSKHAHRLADLLDELSEIYKKHIAIEDGELFPLAERVLDPVEIEALGCEMAARRGIDLNRNE